MTEVRRVAEDPPAEEWLETDRILLRVADELHSTSTLCDATWTQMTVHWEQMQLMDIVFTVGHYTMTAMALRAFGVQREHGIPGFPTA